MVDPVSMRFGQTPDGNPDQVSVSRVVYAVRLWLGDAVRGRLTVYHWQRRRRRLDEYDRRARRAS